MQTPTIAVVLRLEGRVSGTAIPAEAQRFAKFDYVDHFDEASQGYSSQLRFWEGAYRNFQGSSSGVCDALEKVTQYIKSSDLDLSKAVLEIAIFTDSDNQALVLPQNLLNWMAANTVQLSVMFFRTE
jgi:hypothetical protein